MENYFPVRIINRESKYDILFGNKLINFILNNKIKQAEYILENGASVLMPFLIDQQSGHIIDFLLLNGNKKIFKYLIEKDLFIKNEKLNDVLNNNEHLFSKDKILMLIYNLIEADEIESIDIIIKNLDKNLQIKNEVPRLILEYIQKNIKNNIDNNQQMLSINHYDSKFQSKLLYEKLFQINPNLVVWMLNKDNPQNFLTSNVFNNQLLNVQSDYLSYNKILTQIKDLIMNNNSDLEVAAEIKKVVNKENLDKSLNKENSITIKPTKI